MQARAVHRLADRVVIGSLGKLHIDKRAPAEVYPQRNPIPEQHGEYAGRAEH